MYVLTSFISGLIMSIGLIISGMINPKKVIGFLDLFGSFDPTLAFVMAGALGVAFIGYHLAGSNKPMLCASFDLPKKTKIDIPLILGAVMFGIGWGLAGFCPGPAIVGIGLGLSKAVVFVAAMILGMFMARRFLIGVK